MIPILYQPDTTDFSNNGAGFLRDAAECTVTEERNGAFELVLKYPVDGWLYDSITEGAIIKATANETSPPQLFRCYKSTKPIKGVVTFSAEHISYELNGNHVVGLALEGVTAQEALSTVFRGAILPHGFTAWSDVDTIGTIRQTTPLSVRALMGGVTGSILDVFGGEYEFDNFAVKLHAARGVETDVVIEYGKNLVDLKQERNISNVYTCFFPYAKRKDETTLPDGTAEQHETIVTLPGQIIKLRGYGGYGHDKALKLDMTDYFKDGEDITAENLLTHATTYLEQNAIDAPKVNITVAFVPLSKTTDYANIAPLERVALCDTVTVRFARLGVTATAKVIKTVYNTLTDRYDSVEIGEAKSSFADTVLKQEATLSAVEDEGNVIVSSMTLALKNAIKTATNLITGQSGGYVVLNPAEHPQEILIMDTPSIETAQKVWRWNSAGLGYSKTGYNGEFGLAMTMDGAIVADYITTGVLKSIEINGGTIVGGTVNISDKFKVDAQGNAELAGNIRLSGNISWGAGSSPVKVEYSATGSSWHGAFNSNDYFARYSYDGGKTWTDAIKVRGTDGSDGRDGSDANVPEYIKQTFIDMTSVSSPYIVGASLQCVGASAGPGDIDRTTEGLIFFNGRRVNDQIVGAITFDTSGAGTSEEASERVFIAALNGYALKIYTDGGNISIGGGGGLVWINDPIFGTSSGNISAAEIIDRLEALEAAQAGA